MRGRWSNIIVLNVHEPNEEKSDDSIGSFYEELEEVFDHFHKDHMKILLGDINPYPTAFPYGNGMVLHFYQQQESSTTKTVHKVINKGLKAYV